MSAQLLKLQTWAPTDCAECCSGLLASRKEENLTSFAKRKKVGPWGVNHKLKLMRAKVFR